jgi:hypothetical protein
MNPTQKDQTSKSVKAEVEQSKKTAQAMVLSDPIGFIIERIVSLGAGVKVKAHDEQWVDVSFESGSIEHTIRGLREIAESTRRGLSADGSGERRQRPRKTAEGDFVEKLSPSSKAAASFCIAADGKLYMDAVPLPLKAYLANFIEDLCGVGATKATMTAGICAEIRSSDTYLPNT